MSSCISKIHYMLLQIAQHRIFKDFCEIQKKHYLVLYFISNKKSVIKRFFVYSRNFSFRFENKKYKILQPTKLSPTFLQEIKFFS